MSSLAGYVLAPIALAAAVLAAYLVALSVAAIVPVPAPRPARRKRRFAVLVPANDEAGSIGRLLESLHRQDYPTSAFEVFVVADNCSDATAEIARRHGAVVHERHEPLHRSKGHALAWLLERVRIAGPFDAYVIFDADSVVSSTFLSNMNARLASGSRVLQAHYRVLNDEASGAAAIRQAAFASLHYLRPRGRAVLGLSCGLKGNGMCFEAAILDRIGWTRFGQAEDVELHLDLVRAGIRVDFAPEAVVWADMPGSLRAASSQNLRWEAGRLAALRHDVVPLLAHAITKRDPVALDAAIEQLIPPLSVSVMVSSLCAVAAVTAGQPAIAALATAGAVGPIAHVLAGMVAVGAPARSYVALLRAPAYLWWKVAIYARALRAPATSPWVRTQR